MSAQLPDIPKASDPEFIRLFIAEATRRGQDAVRVDLHALTMIADALEQALERERQLREALNILGYPISFDTPAPEIFEHATDLARKRGWGAKESGERQLEQEIEQLRAALERIATGKETSGDEPQDSYGTYACGCSWDSGPFPTYCRKHAAVNEPAEIAREALARLQGEESG